MVIDTESSSNDVSLDALKAVVDPLNWHEDCPSFFCDMQYKGLRTDGWRKVLETVGFCDYSSLISPRLVTMLKFYKTTVNGPVAYEARLDYDLDMSRFDTGDRQVRVDKGFINMKSTVGDAKEKGVRVSHPESRSYCGNIGIRSSPVGLYPAGTAPRRRISCSAPPQRPPKIRNRSTSRPTKTRPTPKPRKPPPLPRRRRRRPTSCRPRSTRGQSARRTSPMALRRRPEVAVRQPHVDRPGRHTTRASGELASTPWKYLQAMTTPRTPGKPGGTK